MQNLTKEDFKESVTKALKEGFAGASEEAKRTKILDDLIKIPDEIAYSIVDPIKIRKQINERISGTTRTQQLDRIRDRMYRNEVKNPIPRAPQKELFEPAGDPLNTAFSNSAVKEVRLFKKETPSVVINNPYLTSASTVQGKQQIKAPVNTVFGIGSLNTPIQASYVQSGMLEQSVRIPKRARYLKIKK